MIVLCFLGASLLILRIDIELELFPEIVRENGNAMFAGALLEAVFLVSTLCHMQLKFMPIYLKYLDNMQDITVFPLTIVLLTCRALLGSSTSLLISSYSMTATGFSSAEHQPAMPLCNQTHSCLVTSSANSLIQLTIYISEVVHGYISIITYLYIKW